MNIIAELHEGKENSNIQTNDKDNKNMEDLYNIKTGEAHNGKICQVGTNYK